MWIPPQQNVTLPGPLTATLLSSKLFTSSQVEEILKKAQEKEWKEALTGNTQKVLDQGAFGAPWMWVSDGKGKEEPFFGSDRYVFLSVISCEKFHANMMIDSISCGSFWDCRGRILQSCRKEQRQGKRSCERF